MLLEVDGQNGKRVIRLDETLIVPNISVNLFSIQCVLSKGYLPVYGEVDNERIIKEKDSTGKMVQVAAMTMNNGRATLDCVLYNDTRRSSGPAPHIDTFKVELDMQLLHRRLGHSGIDAQNDEWQLGARRRQNQGGGSAAM